MSKCYSLEAIFSHIQASERINGNSRRQKEHHKDDVAVDDVDVDSDVDDQQQV